MCEHSLIPHPEWQDFISIFWKNGKSLLVLGGVDSGKTSFLLWVLQKLLEKKFKVALLDSDIGQSTIGTPAVVGVECFLDFPKSLPVILPAYWEFVGVVSPREDTTSFLEAIASSYLWVKKVSPDKLLIDTTGFIKGEEALAIKKSKIKLLSPTYVVILGKVEEELYLLKHYIENLCISKVFILPPSPALKLKSHQQRIAYRNTVLESYFKDFLTCSLSWEEVKIPGIPLGEGRELPIYVKERISSVLNQPVYYAERIKQFLYLALPFYPDINDMQILKEHFKVEKVFRLWFKDLLGVLVGEGGKQLSITLVKELDFNLHRIIFKKPPTIALSQIKSIKIGRYSLTDI